MLPLQASTRLARHCVRPMIIKALVARSGACRSMHIPSIHRLSSSAAAARSVEMNKGKMGPIDPSRLFDQVDADKDGSINKHEFLTVLQLVKHEDIMKAQADARDNLERLSRKMESVERLEQHMADLEANYELKHQTYNNIGMRTAAEIDELFTESKLKKDNIKDSIGELKSLIYEARAIFNSAAKQHQ